nr:MAG TPA: hypothetical protein [Caudoviricetes sp.]
MKRYLIILAKYFSILSLYHLRTQLSHLLYYHRLPSGQLI